MVYGIITKPSIKNSLSSLESIFFNKNDIPKNNNVSKAKNDILNSGPNSSHVNIPNIKLANNTKNTSTNTKIINYVDRNKV